MENSELETREELEEQIHRIVDTFIATAVFNEFLVQFCEITNGLACLSEALCWPEVEAVVTYTKGRKGAPGARQRASRRSMDRTFVRYRNYHCNVKQPRHLPYQMRSY